MFAFKVLNLKKSSSRLIFILLSLSLGLFSLLAASPYNPSFLTFSLPHLPYFIFNLLMLFFYALSGNSAYEIYFERKKEKNFDIFSFLISYIIILIYPFCLFKCTLIMPCLILSAITFFILIRNRLHLWSLYQGLIALYFTYITLVLIFIL